MSEKRNHPHMWLWLGFKVDIIQTLLAQKRYEDCQDAIAITKLEANCVNDILFNRRLLEFEFLIAIEQGDLREAHLKADDIRAHAVKYHQSDRHYCNFMGNLSELVYNESKSADAIAIIEIARAYSRNRITEYGSETDL